MIQFIIIQEIEVMKCGNKGGNMTFEEHFKKQITREHKPRKTANFEVVKSKIFEKQIKKIERLRAMKPDPESEPVHKNTGKAKNTIIEPGSIVINIHATPVFISKYKTFKNLKKYSGRQMLAKSKSYIQDIGEIDIIKLKERSGSKQMQGIGYATKPVYDELKEKSRRLRISLSAITEIAILKMIEDNL